MNFKGITDVDTLQQLAGLQHEQLQRALKKMSAMAAELAELKGVPVTGELALIVDTVKTTEPERPAPRKSTKRSRRKRQKSGPTPQPDLRQTQEMFELDEPDKVCPQCGDPLQPMVGQTEDSELIDIIGIEYVLKTVKRQKYSCQCGCIDTAIGPHRASSGSRYSLDFALHVVTAKYLDHLPLERQVRMMQRAGLTVTSQTLWNLVFGIAMAAKPTWEALREHALAQPVIGLDQTGWPRLDDKSKKKWQMWCLTTDRIVFHHIRDDKSAATFEDLVGAYHGYVVCDDLSTHRAGARGSPEITLVGCWAHIYRRFREVAHDFPQAQVALGLIRWLYDVDKYSPPEQLGKNRKLWSKLVLDELYSWMTSMPVPKTTSLGRAILHTFKNKERLWKLIDDPVVWLDNNPTERSLRGPVVGRRNHFGSKSRRGTLAASIIYSLVETAKLNGVDPSTYLHAVVVAVQQDKNAVVLPWDIPTVDAGRPQSDAA